MAKGHEYCCCAIPLMNVGIYLTILEQFTVSLTAGILSIATPQLVGSSIPSFGPWLVAIGGFILCGAQGMGFFGVFKENATLFQRYVQINAALVVYIFSVSATWIIISATRHSTATTDCIQDFFANNATTVDQGSVFADDGQGPTICNIFTWVSVGIMGGLWIIMLIFQGYLLLVCRWYSVSQLADHSKYYSIYSVNPPEGIALGDRQRGEDAWDPRPSTESWSGGGMTSPGVARPGFGAHSRQNSDVNDRAYGVSAADAYAEKKPTYGYRDDPTSHNYPDQAYVNDSEAPTPVALTSPDRRFKGEPDQYDNAQSGTALPPGAMYPTEGQFGRKTPRAAADAYANYPAQGYAPPYHSEDPYYRNR